MKSIIRLSLVVMMFSLFLTLYLVTSISAQMAAPDMSPPSTFDDNLMGAQGQGMGQRRGGRDQSQGMGQRRGGRDQGQGMRQRRGGRTR